MKILVIGASGAIGKIITPLLAERHEIVTAGRNSGDIQVDIALATSIENMFKTITKVDACICVAGDSYAGELLSMTEEKLSVGIKNKLLSQANLVLIGQKYLNDNGSFTLTSGKMGDKPSKNAAGKAIVNGGINSFVLAASLEMPRGIRINVVSPAKISDIPVKDLALGYTKSVEGNANGEVIKINY
jgi:NAD(P)-dependent dehydrogenase (short-subunit alcohol dehydrogenase family)